MYCLAGKNMGDGQSAYLTPMRWKTYKERRHTQGTVGSEPMSLARGIAECEWARSLMAEALNYDYTLNIDKSLGEKIGMIITVDNRPIFDHTTGGQIVVCDKGMAIDVLIVRRDIQHKNIQLRWVESKHI